MILLLWGTGTGVPLFCWHTGTGAVTTWGESKGDYRHLWADWGTSPISFSLTAHT